MENISSLVNQIKYYANLYYTGKPTISDAEFDALVERLRSVDSKNPILTTVGWGYEVNSDDKVRHPFVKMEGLSKSFINNDDYVQFSVVTPKLDGANVEVIYKNGYFSKAITRGNGEYGQDVTDKLRLIVPPKFIDNGTYLIHALNNSIVSISGEFIMSKDNLNKYYPNEISHRNIASGILNRDNVVEATSQFSFIPYRLNAIYGNTVSVKYLNRESIQKVLNELFNVNVPMIKDSYQSYKEIFKYFSDNFNYNFDGIVVNTGVNVNTVGNITYIEYKEHAYKTITDTANVVVTDVDWNITRTGRLVPLVHFDPVELSGAVIKKATGNNAAWVIDRGISKGAVVKITRSGEVIPKILEVITPVDTNNLKVYCPVCGHEAVMDGTDFKCNNPECINKSYENVYRWLSYIGEVKGAGSSLYNDMIEYAQYESVIDIYKKDIDWSHYSEIDGVGDSRVELLNKVLDNVRKNPIKFSWYLVGCNIKGVSTKTANILEESSNLKDCLDSENFDKFDISNCKGIGQSVYSSIKNNWKLLCDIYKCVKNQIEEYYEYFDNIIISDISNKIKICITGKLNSGTKSNLYNKYSDIIIESDVSNCDVLISNGIGSTKYNKAKSLGKTIMTEDEFYEYIEGVNNNG